MDKSDEMKTNASRDNPNRMYKQTHLETVTRTIYYSAFRWSFSGKCSSILRVKILLKIIQNSVWF
jgi:hypothetical protein